MDEVAEHLSRFLVFLQRADRIASQRDRQVCAQAAVSRFPKTIRRARWQADANHPMKRRITDDMKRIIKDETR